MDILQKVTITYVPLEDRLRFSVETETSETYLFWVTARLASAVVAPLIKSLDPPLPVPQPLEQKTLQQWQQFSATQQLKATAVPVKDPPLREELIQSVDVSIREGRYLLTFHGVKQTVARLPLTVIQMRQWLQIVYQQFLVAGWPMTVWPTWFAMSKSTDHPYPSVVLH